MAKAAPAADTGIVEIHGTQYHTVAKRLGDFRKDHPDYTIVTSLLSADKYVRVRAEIRDNQQRTISTGHSEENREFGINRTSAVENAETSAVGRALGLMGYLGTVLASADEMQTALEQQPLVELKELQRHNEALSINLPRVAVMKGALDLDEYETAKVVWQEISHEDRRALWLPPAKGGIFTVEEREKMNSQQWRNADATSEKN